MKNYLKEKDLNTLRDSSYEDSLNFKQEFVFEEKQKYPKSENYPEKENMFKKTKINLDKNSILEE